MKKVLFYGACALVSLGLALPAPASQPAPPAEPLKMALTEKPVVFEHAKHAARECVECHHLVEGVANYQKCSTAGCHDVIDKADKSVHSYYRIAHERKTDTINSCISCHTTVAGNDKDRKKAMTSCVGSSCHPKS